MIPQIALVLNGPFQWYENLSLKFEKYGRTWLQQDNKLNRKNESIFNEIIRNDGYFLALGYVQDPVKKINYLLHINLVVSGDKKRLPPPDETAPDYDITYDKCRDEEDFNYSLWLRVIHFEKIAPIEPDKLILSNTGNPLRIARSAHYYVNIPDKFTRKM